MNSLSRTDPPVRHSVWNVWNNPIFRRYCRSRLRARGLGISLLISVLLSGFFVAMMTSISVKMDLSSTDAARNAIIPLVMIQGFILFVLGTAQVAGGMTAERDEGIIDYQRLIPMSPLAKVTGYLFGLPVREHVMFLSTVPFTAWCLWRGQVEVKVWLPLYAVFFSSTMLYHLTGLITGTVVRNRRWAFLASIGLVFCLYTIIPQLAKFGLVFFKYLTITPVFEESLPGILPKTAGEMVRMGQQILPSVKFFNLDFSESVFTFFSQSGLILTFIIMLCRKWRRAESHLLGKLWAPGFFIWIQVLLLGNALPLIGSGGLFPSRGFARMTQIMPDWTPQPLEAVVMSGLFGLVTLLMILVLGGLLTPTTARQREGWRRARKQGKSSLPWLGDAATGFWSTTFMALAGAVGWFIFTRGLVESHWFPDQHLPWHVLGYFITVMLAAGLGYQVLLEHKGGRMMGLLVILIGVAPVMAGAVMSVIDRMMPAALWVIGFSPMSLPFYGAGTLLPISKLPESAKTALPSAFYFWLAVMSAVLIWRVILLHRARKAIAQSVLANG